jgi:uridine kinase
VSNFVIAISAASGGGKTALVKRTAELLDGTTLFFDDYAPRLDPYPEDLINWIENGADLNQWKAPHFAKAVAALKRGESVAHPDGHQTIVPRGFIVIEDPIGRGHDEMSELIDFMVFIDTPLEIALARRLLSNLDYLRDGLFTDLEKRTAGESIETIISALRRYLTDYLDVSRPVYVAVAEQVKANCDLILNGCLEVDELARQLVSAVNSYKGAS